MTARQRATIAELRHVVNSCCKHSLRELTRHQARCAKQHADAARLGVWLSNIKRKPASSAFAEGPERQVAVLVEILLWLAKK